MSQPQAWALPTSGPLAPDALMALIQGNLDALNSTSKGATQPAYRVAGTMWLYDGISPWVLRIYDGLNWLDIATINPTTHALIWTNQRFPMSKAPPEMTWLSAGSIQVAAGSCRSEDDAVDIIIPSAIVLTPGTLPANTSRHIMVGYNASGNPAAIFSSGYTLPSNWQTYRRIGSVRSDASGNIRPFVQNGDLFLTDMVTDVNVTNQTAAGVLRSLSVPTGVSVLALYRARYVNAAVAVWLFTSPLETDVAPDTAVGNVDGVNPANSSLYSTLSTLTDTSGRIRSRSTVAGGTLIISTYGWIDKRGRDK